MQEELQGMQQAEPLSEFDTSKDIEELQGLQKELADIEASVESDFAKYISEVTNNDASFEEMFFSDREAFFKRVIEEQNKFVQNLVEPRLQRANELQTNIQGKNELANIENIKQKFQSEHPDVDVGELIKFFVEELPAKVQEQIKVQPIEEFFNIVYELYSQQYQEPQEEEQIQEELPEQTQGVPVSSEDSQSNSAYLQMNRY